MRGRSGISSSKRKLLMDIHENNTDYEFDTYGMYSLRYLNRNYTGDVILGYKDSSGVTQGFTPVEIVDGTLTTFANGDHVRVKTWYDQSGNGNDASQTSRYNMPTVVISGSLMTLGGLPAVNFDGTNDFIPLNSALPNIRIGHCSSFCVGETDDAVASSLAMMLSLGWSNSNARWFVPSLYSSNFNFGYASYWNIDTSTADTDPHVITGIAGSTQGNFQPFIDGVSTGSFTRQVRNSAGVYGIGGGKTVSSYPLDGRVSEVLVFDGDCSPTRTDIEKNINDYFDIY